MVVASERGNNSNDSLWLLFISPSVSYVCFCLCRMNKETWSSHLAGPWSGKTNQHIEEDIGNPMLNLDYVCPERQNRFICPDKHVVTPDICIRTRWQDWGDAARINGGFSHHGDGHGTVLTLGQVSRMPVEDVILRLLLVSDKWGKLPKGLTSRRLIVFTCAQHKNPTGGLGFSCKRKCRIRIVTELWKSSQLSRFCWCFRQQSAFPRCGITQPVLRRLSCQEL